ncbi:MAG TPA: cytidylate kinase [Candidatus Caldiarchaeum subterraneum]|uniref:Cytidylate kinase n=1 Tax=Caldiarchaeum subterraneum TaxID=311458 RepID=A0A833ECB1_CALS0|nr:cytidylate kinase [Candidatus Caldarchaeum subterraneum]
MIDMREKVVVCISGFAATGKSTVGRRLAKNLGLRYISGGDALKSIAVEMGYRPGGKDWWEREQGLKFLAKRGEDPSFDRRVDEKLMEMALEGDVVIDSWVLPWLLDRERSYNIWLNASEEARAERMARRSGLSRKKALEILRQRDRESSEIYKKLYGIELGRDFKPFHLVVDTTLLSEEQVYRVVEGCVRRFFRI